MWGPNRIIVGYIENQNNFPLHYRTLSSFNFKWAFWEFSVSTDDVDCSSLHWNPIFFFLDSLESTFSHYRLNWENGQWAETTVFLLWVCNFYKSSFPSSNWKKAFSPAHFLINWNHHWNSYFRDISMKYSFRFINYETHVLNFSWTVSCTTPPFNVSKFYALCKYYNGERIFCLFKTQDTQFLVIFPNHEINQWKSKCPIVNKIF